MEGETSPAGNAERHSMNRGLVNAAQSGVHPASRKTVNDITN